MSMPPARSALEARVARELSTPAPPETMALVDALRSRFADQVDAVLFYGSCRRTGDMAGLLDLYVLHNGGLRFHRRWLPALVGYLLPPNVMQLIVRHGAGATRAKVAIMSRRQFARRMRTGSLDTTVWTRFCQPASLLHARDEAVRRCVEQAVAEGIRTAVAWAIRFGPAGAEPSACWQALFTRTYRLELRPEMRGQARLVYEAAATWFDDIITLARAETAEHGPGGRLPPWYPRRLVGKPLNLLRLVKAAFTFEGGADYLSAKLGRHTGLAPVPTDWQRRHPLLGAPKLLWQHRRATRAHRRQVARGRS